MSHVLRSVSAVCCGIAGFLWGEMDGLFVALIALVCLDYLSGIIVGAARHKLNSQTSFKGICKKALILIIVAVAHIVDAYVLGGTKAVFKSGICGLFCANEGMSILENAGKLGLPLPKKLTKFLEQLKDESDKED
ncbi:MAG: phage holin family protein [Oscillospiraceae bacterium]|nr:phage holin family protein [Oscillospiraceae bacterium]